MSLNNAYVPTIEEVKDCYRRLINAGGVLPVGNTPFESDFFQSTIDRAATMIVIEGWRYWEVREQPLLDGLLHEVKSESSEALEDLFC